MLMPHTLNKQTKPRLPKEFGDILFADQQIALFFVIHLIGKSCYNSKHLRHLLNISSADYYKCLTFMSPYPLEFRYAHSQAMSEKHRFKDIMCLFEDFKPVNDRSEIQIQTLLPTSV